MFKSKTDVPQYITDYYKTRPTETIKEAREQNIIDILRVCEQYAKLGGAVQEQVDKLLDQGPDRYLPNRNAWRYIEEWLHDVQSYARKTGNSRLADDVSHFIGEVSNAFDDDED